MKTILVIFIYGFGGSTPAVIQTAYETREACEVAGKQFDFEPTLRQNGPGRSHVCIAAPK